MQNLRQSKARVYTQFHLTELHDLKKGMKWETAHNRDFAIIQMCCLSRVGLLKTSHTHIPSFLKAFLKSLFIDLNNKKQELHQVIHSIKEVAIFFLMQLCKFPLIVSHTDYFLLISLLSNLG